MVVGVINLGFSNIRSIMKSLKNNNISVHEISNAKQWHQFCPFDKVIFPGVGSFNLALKSLNSAGLMIPLMGYINEGGWYLGICLGMQVLFEYGYEGGGCQGLALISGEVIKIQPNHPSQKIPHNGWNEVCWTSDDDPIRSEIPDKKDFYFNHSYSVQADTKNILALTPYGSQGVVSVIRKGNIYGTQFHPEKSQQFGCMVLKNFMSLV